MVGSNKWRMVTSRENAPSPMHISLNHKNQQSLHIYYYTPVPLNLGNKKASKQALLLPFWPLLCPNASGSTLLRRFSALTHGLPKSGVRAPTPPVAAHGANAKSGCALPNQNGPFSRLLWTSDERKRVKTSPKWALFTCLCIPNAPGSILGKRVFDAFLTQFWSQNNPFSRHFSDFWRVKTVGSNHAKTTCFGIHAKIVILQMEYCKVNNGGATAPLK